MTYQIDTQKAIQSGIRLEYEELRDEIETTYKRIRNLQDFCTHPNAEKVNNGSSGNYDPSSDGYWRDCKCLDCGKIWVEDQ